MGPTSGFLFKFKVQGSRKTEKTVSGFWYPGSGKKPLTDETLRESGEDSEFIVRLRL